jgi:hypothetical protein
VCRSRSSTSSISELFHPTVHTYQPDLSALPALQDVPRDAADPRWAKAAWCPSAWTDAVARMTEALARGDTVHAIEAAGELAHYAQDNTQPHHATVDFRGLSISGGRDRRATRRWNRWEASSGLSPERRAMVFDAFVAALDGPFPTVSDDAWRATVEVARESYRCLPTIGEEAVASTTDGVLDVERFYARPGPDVEGPPIGMGGPAHRDGLDFRLERRPSVTKNATLGPR